MKHVYVPEVQLYNLLYGFNFHNDEAGFATQLPPETHSTAAPFSLNRKYLGSVPLTDSDMANLLEVNFEQETSDNVAIVRHECFRIAAANNLKATVDEWRFKCLHRLLFYGIEISGIKYDFLASSPAYLKTGKAMFVRSDLKRKHARDLLFRRDTKTLENWSPCEQNKVLSVLMSSSEVVEGGITADQMLILNDVDYKLVFDKAIVVDSEAHAEIKSDYQNPTTVADGQLLFIADTDEELEKFAALQGRIGNNKFFGAAVKRKWIQERADFWHVKVPESFDTPFGHKQVFDEHIKIVATDSCVKGRKWFTSFGDMSDTLRKMGTDKLRACRYAAETFRANGETRFLSGAGLQELFSATNEQLFTLAAKPAEKLAKMNTLEGLLEHYQQKEGNLGQAFRDYPMWLKHPLVAQACKESWEKHLAENATKPSVPDSRYEYVAIDPIALIDVLILGISPYKHRVGMLDTWECHTCGVDNGTEIAAIRYPANLLNFCILKNKSGFNKVWHYYDHLKGVLVLSFYNVALTGYWDGDNDGDEVWETTTQTVIDMVKAMWEAAHPLPVVFPHDKAQKGHYPATREEYVQAQTQLLWDGMKYNRVGIYANMAKKILAGLTEGNCRDLVMKALYHHIMAILILDFIKTGKLPEEIMKVADKMFKDYPLFPYSHRFGHHTRETPYYDTESWDNVTTAESQNVCDRYARAVNCLVMGVDNPDLDIDKAVTAMYSVDLSPLPDFKEEDIILGGFKGFVKRGAVTPAIERIRLITGRNMKNMVGVSDIFMTMYDAYTKLSYIENKDLRKEELSAAIPAFRSAMAEFVRLDEKFADLSEQEAHRCAAEQIYKWMHSDKRRQTSNDVALLLFLLELYGDIFGRNFYNKTRKSLDDMTWDDSNLDDPFNENNNEEQQATADNKKGDTTMSEINTAITAPVAAPVSPAPAADRSILMTVEFHGGDSASFRVTLSCKDKPSKVLTGTAPNCPPNKMGLIGVLTGLKKIGAKCHLTIAIDGLFYDAVNNGWLRQWSTNGWKTKSGSPVLHQDIWNSIIAELKRVCVGKVTVKPRTDRKRKGDPYKPGAKQPVPNRFFVRKSTDIQDDPAQFQAFAYQACFAGNPQPVQKFAAAQAPEVIDDYDPSIYANLDNSDMLE